MGTGTLEEAIRWLEYCNGTGDTSVLGFTRIPPYHTTKIASSSYCREYANLRRKNTGADEPHNVMYWGLGNEIWGEWQVSCSLFGFQIQSLLSYFLAANCSTSRFCRWVSKRHLNTPGNVDSGRMRSNS